MNRVKKELRRRGVKLENDYEYMPYDGIQAVIVQSDLARVKVVHTSIVNVWELTRSGDLVNVEWY